MPSEHDIAFPRLSRAQIDALRRWGHVRSIAPGDVLFQEGDRGFSFYVVLEGAVEIVEQSRGTPHEVTVHEPGEFTGDVDTLSGRASLVTGRATARGEVLVVPRDESAWRVPRGRCSERIGQTLRVRGRRGRDGGQFHSCVPRGGFAGEGCVRIDELMSRVLAAQRMSHDPGRRR